MAKNFKMIPASGIIIDKAKGLMHILNPGRPRVMNVAQGFYDATGFHPIRASSDYDSDAAGDEYSSTGKKRKKAKAKKRVKAKAKSQSKSRKKGKR